MENLENLKNDIYKWFDNELSVIIENNKKVEYEKRLQKGIIRIKENDTRNRRLHQTGYDFDTLIKNAIEKAIKNNEAATKKVINDLKIMIKNHIDKILNNIKYSSFDEIFEDAKQKRTHYINDRHGVYFLKIYEYILDYISESQKPIKPEHKEITNSEILKATLKKYNFFELNKVNSLTKENQTKLFDFIKSNDLPYNIAMFDYLDFFKYLLKEHFQTKAALHKEVSQWFRVTERQIKGNLLVLNDYSKENRNRYTANDYKQTVINDYQLLK